MAGVAASAAEPTLAASPAAWGAPEAAATSRRPATPCETGVSRCTRGGTCLSSLSWDRIPVPGTAATSIPAASSRAACARAGSAVFRPPAQPAASRPPMSRQTGTSRQSHAGVTRPVPDTMGMLSTVSAAFAGFRPPPRPQRHGPNAAGDAASVRFGERHAVASVAPGCSGTSYCASGWSLK